MSVSNDFIKELITDETPVRILIETQAYNAILQEKGRPIAEGTEDAEGYTMIETMWVEWEVYYGSTEEAEEATEEDVEVAE